MRDMSEQADPGSEPPIDRLTEAARDSLHISVGLGILAFQAFQVRRHELGEQLTESGDVERIKAVARWLVGWQDDQ